MSWPAAGLCPLVPSGQRQEYLQSDVAYQCTDKIFVAERVEKRNVEDQDAHLLFSCQEASLLLNFFLIASQTVYVRDVERSLGCNFHQRLILRPFKILAGLRIHVDAVLRDAAFRHG